MNTQSSDRHEWRHAPVSARDNKLYEDGDYIVNMGRDGKERLIIAVWAKSPMWPEDRPYLLGELGDLSPPVRMRLLERILEALADDGRMLHGTPRDTTIEVEMRSPMSRERL